ncbi:MAG: hypothetical protein AAF357_19730 [Verrucomicrobiota bacterium]
MKTALLPMMVAAMSCGLVSAQNTAEKALEALGKQIGDFDQFRLVSVTGVDGKHQPDDWEVILLKRGQSGHGLEYRIQEGRVSGPVSVTVDHGYSRSFDRAKLQIDSTRAFLEAENAAKTAQIGFDRINYSLAWRGNDSAPSWLATLIDLHDQVVVGHVFILADTGKVQYQRFFEPELVEAPRALRAVSGIPPSAAGQANKQPTVKAGSRSMSQKAHLFGAQ